MARPQFEIDWTAVERYAVLQYTQEDIAKLIGVSLRRLTADKKFSPIYKKAHQFGKNSIRAKQYEVAMKGNTTMLIWLGKQYLGQTDQPDFNKEREQIGVFINIVMNVIGKLDPDVKQEIFNRVKSQLGEGAFLPSPSTD
jgi:hypothetical protein